MPSAQSQAYNSKVKPLLEGHLRSTSKQLPRVAFWLVPQLEERKKLQSLIVELAERFSAPVFVPHVTVYSCWRTAQQRELAVIAGLAGNCQPITMALPGLAEKDRLTQTLFCELQKSVALTRLFHSLEEGLLPSAGRELEPHLSLLYQNLPASVREALVRETMIPLQEIRCDELWAVAIPGQLNAPDDFRGWQTLLIRRLDSL